MTVTVWDAGPYELGEGARRVGNQLYFVDILSGRLLEAPSAAGGASRVLAQLEVPLGAVAPVAGRPDAWIAAAGTGIAVLDAGGELRWIDRPEDGGAVATRMNDGCCDPAGRFWAGSMAYDNTPGAGSLYRIEPDGTVTRVLDGLTIVNGPAFDVTGAHMFVADTPTGRISRHALDAAGDIVGSELFVEIDSSDGSPDGMTVDDEGRLWVAMWGASSVRCYGATGELHQVIRTPARQPTSVCLGGTGDSRLFITTAALGINPAGDSDGARRSGDGALLCVAVDASAPPTSPWAGA